MKWIFVCMIHPVLLGFIGGTLVYFWLTPCQMLWFVMPVFFVGLIGLFYTEVVRGK